MNKFFKTCSGWAGVGIANSSGTIPPQRITVISTKLIIDVTVITGGSAAAVNFLAYAVDGCVAGLTTNAGFFKKVRGIIGTFTSARVWVRYHIVRAPARRRGITRHVTFGTTHPVATLCVTTIF